MKMHVSNMHKPVFVSFPSATNHGWFQIFLIFGRYGQTVLDTEVLDNSCTNLQVHQEFWLMASNSVLEHSDQNSDSRHFDTWCNPIGTEWGSNGIVCFERMIQNVLAHLDTTDSCYQPPIDDSIGNFLLGWATMKSTYQRVQKIVSSSLSIAYRILPP